MRIVMNKDLTQQKGPGIRLIITIILIGLISCAGSLFLHYGAGLRMELCIYLCVPVISIIGFFGFYEKDGMSFPEILMRKQMNRTYRILYKSTEEPEKQKVKVEKKGTFLKGGELPDGFDK